MIEERRAILIASSQFPAEPKLAPLRCPENDVDGLEKLLRDDVHGGYEEVVSLKNRPHHEVLKTINVALKRARKGDAVLIYYSGHGKLDRAGRLYLAAWNTETEALESTSIPVATVLDYIRLSSCRNVGLVLDCCYSGAVGESILRGSVEDQLQNASSSGGVYILTASTGVQAAEEKEEDEYGLLTKYIIRGIESGEADFKEDGNISMDDLYLYVHRKVKEEGFQEPMKWDLNVAGELIIARSGKMPREERRKQLRQMMLDYAKGGQVSDRLLGGALEVLNLRPDDLHGEMRRRDELLHELFDKRLPLGEFVDRWNVPAPGGPVAPLPPSPPQTAPPWWRRHARTIAMVLAPVALLTVWATVWPPGRNDWFQRAGEETKPLVPPLAGQNTAPSPVTAPDAGPLKAGTVRPNPKDGQRYVWIPPGEYQMGCSPDDSKCEKDERPRHLVRITHGFWMGQTEVTQAAYENVAGNNPSQFRGPQHPVESVYWDEALKYCEAAGGRLPTEAEWEYAARAGSTSERYGELDAIAWHWGNALWEDGSGRKGTHPVQQKQPNAWGLYDMLGNVHEWVTDWYEGNYYETLSSPAVDPKGPPPGKRRVLRGGSWGPSLQASPIRASYRATIVPGARVNSFGFRCAVNAIP